MTGFKTLVTLAALALVTACASTPQPTGPQSRLDTEISVLDVIDGDTIKLAQRATGGTINARLVGFDAPETFEPGCAAELELGQKATQRLQVILARGQDIRPTPLGFDRFGRQLLRLSVDGRDLADIMIAEGLAVAYDGGRRINWCRKLAAS